MDKRKFLKKIIISCATDAFSSACFSRESYLFRGKVGCFFHFIPSSWDGLNNAMFFDVKNFVINMIEIGADHVFFTLGQNSGFFNSPNYIYAKYSKQGNKCLDRDFILELSRELRKNKINFFLYLPCQAPAFDVDAKFNFGLPKEAGNSKINYFFANRWADVIREWSDRYGDNVSGWWFDGAYDYVGFDDYIAQLYRSAALSGNGSAVVAFNKGVGFRYNKKFDDYMAGELNDLSCIPGDIEGVQRHVLTYMGNSWASSNIRGSFDIWMRWVKCIFDDGGGVTFDMAINLSDKSRLVGSIDDRQKDFFYKIKCGF